VFLFSWQLIDQENVKTENKLWHFGKKKFNNSFPLYFPALGNAYME